MDSSDLDLLRSEECVSSDVTHKGSSVPVFTYRSPDYKTLKTETLNGNILCRKATGPVGVFRREMIDFVITIHTSHDQKNNSSYV